MIRLIVCATAVTIALVACHPKESEPQHVDDGAPQGRTEATGIRNAEAVGYAGNATANKLDAAGAERAP
jgi:hypothetical protein